MKRHWLAALLIVCAGAAMAADTVPLPKANPNRAAPAPDPAESATAETPVPPAPPVASIANVAPSPNAIGLAPVPEPSAAVAAAFAIFATIDVVPKAKPKVPPRAKTTLASVDPRGTVPQQQQSSAVPQKLSGNCEADLRALKVSFEVLPPIKDGACGAPRPLKVTMIQGVNLKPAATMRCEAALAAAKWIRDGLRPAAQQYLKTQPTEIYVAASYHCRNRRNGRGPSNRLSEHGLANALDVRGMAFSNGETMSVAAKGPGRSRALAAFQADIRAKGCDTFKTVLGPGSDPAHHDHLHFDSAQRRNGSKYCR
ncbi:extensin family protein [Acuticoccus kandeliae]|uniref:extensin-like domain-containing protein n=1 Tax=Acuticoccus kandeliae TaxID=2073160 RepID=UPI000D3E965A|nr:extensin family protein [Acuticoccus kandeliae]